LVLDEPTSSLDAENEASVVESILNCTATKFIVSHRDEFLEHADQVFEVANGMAIPVRGPQAALPNELVSKLWKSK
jgi:ABC-type bacteriocin/lantibiotic exporter with double-glycine peptidase domain